VTLVKVFPGQNVRPGEQVLELTDMSLLRAQVKVGAQYRRLLFVGDKVEIVVGGNQDALPVAGQPASAAAPAPRRDVRELFPDDPEADSGQPAGARRSNVPAAAVVPADAPALPPEDPADRVFIGEIRFIDPVLDNISGKALIKLSVYVPNRVDRYGRYLLYQGMNVEKATVLSQPRE
jgi:hypothetical protein